MLDPHFEDNQKIARQPAIRGHQERTLLHRANDVQCLPGSKKLDGISRAGEQCEADQYVIHH